VKLKEDGMKGFIYIAAWLVLPLTSPSWATESVPLAETLPIHNVVDLAIQKCDGMAATLSNVHQERAEIQRSGLIVLGELGYQVNLMQIPDFRGWTAAIRLHDRSREVDDSYVLFTRTGTSPFDAGYVITRLPDEVANAEHALQIVMQLQRKNAGTGKVSFVHTETPFGQGLEMVVGGRVGSMCFPTSHFRYAKTPQAGSIGISRFVVRGKDLIEYALVLPWPEAMPQVDAIQSAQSRMNVFQRGLQSVAK
jgi:hypothetical protein